MRLASQAKHFQGAKDTTEISSIDHSIRGRVSLGQFLQQFWQWNLFQLSPQRCIRGRRVSQAFEKGPEIKARSTAQHRHAAARLNLADRLMREPRESRGIERIRHLDHVDQMVRHSPSLRDARFSRADVHPAIDLHRINRHNFSADPFRQSQGYSGLAQGGRAS
jgi:glutathione S-transferase